MTDIPKPTGGDVAHLVARAVIGSVPVFGAAGLELFNAVIEPPVSRRRDEWLSALAEQVARLEKMVDEFKVENLKDDEVFVTAVLHATAAALRTHQQEKLDALRNAVLNVALHTSPDEDMQLMFLGFIDKFTPWHIRVLMHFHENPPDWMLGNDPAYLAKAFPGLLQQTDDDLSGRVEFFMQIVHDLESSGLLDTQSPPRATSGRGNPTGKSTELGAQFLQFITLPIP